MSYVIGSFNLLKLYEQTVEQRRRDWELISKIIQTEKIDILAIQEVFSEVPINILKQQLNRSFFSSWESRTGINPTVRNGQREGYAFLWNSKRVSLLPKANGTFYEPEIKANWSRSLIRPPFVGRFIPVGGNVPFVELRIINTHIIHSKDIYSKEKGNEDTGLTLRKNEYQKLSKEIFPKVAKNRIAGKFRPAYTFITGDYNLFQKQCDDIDKSFKSEYKYMLTLQNAPTTLQKSDDKKVTGYTSNDYDHFSFSDHEHDYIHIAERIKAPEKYCQSDFDRYNKDVSDHVPIKMHIDLRTSIRNNLVINLNK